MIEFNDETKEKARRLVRDAGRWLWAANNVLSAVHRAREGSILSKGLAVASIAGKAISMVFPEQTPRDQIVARGYKLADVGLGSFFCSRLMSSGPHRTVLLDGDKDSVRFVFWDAAGETDAVAAVYEKDHWIDGPFLKGGRADLLAAAIESSTWRGSDLMLGVGRSVSRRESEAERLELVSMKDPGVYIGEPGVDWFVERLKRHGDETRSMLLVGPTGAGKSTLGRLIARQLHDKGRVLKISSQALKQFASPDVVDLVVVLKPDVLLLDDVSMIDDRHRDGGADDQMLELFEALHGKAKLLIATLMNRRFADRDESKPRQDGDDPGENYYGGCRPGRIDEVVYVKRPAPRVREQILLHYLGGKEATEALGITKALLADMVERCHGLTGAYLGEVAHRFKVHGIKNYKSEIQSVVAAAPQEGDGPRWARRHGKRRIVSVYSKRKNREERLKKQKLAKEKALEATLEKVVEKVVATGLVKKRPRR